ncbi:hypothetical protein LCGC14_1237920 [marine sediment metagenome]|uniref:Uncharacterized protein n=1 Tax=marine sediment metagenome TaxID=412755 RepID=A0A0F9PAW8_9ZZZZ
MSVFRHGWGGLRVTPIIRCQACDPLPDSSASPQLRPCHITPRLHFRSLQNTTRLHINTSHCTSCLGFTTMHLIPRLHPSPRQLNSRLQLNTSHFISYLGSSSQQRKAPLGFSSPHNSAMHLNSRLHSNTAHLTSRLHCSLCLRLAVDFQSAKCSLQVPLVDPPQKELVGDLPQDATGNTVIDSEIHFDSLTLLLKIPGPFARHCP